MIVEVAESPRNLQYSSSDQISNNPYSGGENTNYRSYQSSPKGKAYQQQQYSEPDQYAAANNYDTQQFGRSLAYETGNGKEKAFNNANYINWNASPGKSFEYQSAYSDGHPVYVDSKSSRAINPTTSSSIGQSLNKHSQKNFNLGRGLSETSDRYSFIKNQKFINKTIERPDSQVESKKNLLLTNLQLEKPLQQYKFVQRFKPISEIREKFIREHPRRFTGFVSNIARV